MPKKVERIKNSLVGQRVLVTARHPKQHGTSQENYGWNDDLEYVMTSGVEGVIMPGDKNQIPYFTSYSVYFPELKRTYAVADKCLEFVGPYECPHCDKPITQHMRDLEDIFQALTELNSMLQVGCSIVSLKKDVEGTLKLLKETILNKKTGGKK